jgi:hypothetical protein
MMADPNAQWTRREQVELNGLKYDITVRKSGNEYSATWFCQECQQHGASTLKSSTPEQASERAQINLFAHHTLVHADPSKTEQP